jgi:8-hydroxy-5-deazaflavin:NADPH oxidoreductase
MKIGIIGSGSIGGTAARLFAHAGHEIAISNSRGPESLADFESMNIQAATVAEAANFGEVVLVAIPFKDYKTLPARELAGKILIDSMNYYPQRDGEMEMEGVASSELVARFLPDSHVIKAFNTMWYKTLANDGKPGSDPEERLVLFIAGDDADAKTTVSRLLDDIGFAAVDTGSLAHSRVQEPNTAIYNKPMKPAEAREMLEG